jgi:chromosome segregation ATPase
MNIETKYSISNAKTLYNKEVGVLSSKLKRLLKNINSLKTALTTYKTNSAEYKRLKKEIDLARQEYDKTLAKLNNSKSRNKKQELARNRPDLNYTQFDYKEVLKKQRELLKGNNEPRFDSMKQFLEGKIASASTNYSIHSLDLVV